MEQKVTRRTMIKSLKRRRDYLEKFIPQLEEASRPCNYEKAEFHSLKWAIETLEALVELIPVRQIVKEVE